MYLTIYIVLQQMGVRLIFSANGAGFVFHRAFLFSDRANQSMKINTTLNRSKRNFIALKSFWWNSKSIPYMLDKSLGKVLA